MTGAMHRDPVWTSRKADGIPTGGLPRAAGMICDMTTAWMTDIAENTGWRTTTAWTTISRLYTEVMK